MLWTENFLVAEDGQRVRYCVYRPMSSPESWFVMCNGRTEYAEKYEHLPADLGFDLEKTAILAWDHRGQGQSDGRRYHIDDFEVFASDCGRVVNTVVGNAPYSLWAHSMGGLIALLALVQGRIRPTKVVLSAPMVGFGREIVSPRVDRLIVRSLCRLGLGRVRWPVPTGVTFENNVLTHSPERFAMLSGSPYESLGPTFSWLLAALQAQEVVSNALKATSFGVPIHILLAEEEALVGNIAARELAAEVSRLGKNQIDLEEIAGARHELFFEADPMYSAAVAHAQGWLHS
jgi:lysophospholipase